MVAVEREAVFNRCFIVAPFNLPRSAGRHYAPIPAIGILGAVRHL